MSQSYAIQLCRLVAPEKLADRFLVSGVLTNEDGVSVSNQLTLVYTFEVAKPWFPSSKVLPTLVEVLQTNFGQLSQGRNLEDQFENLLRLVNEQLNSISEQGETDWIGNFNGLILAFADDEIHFSQTGRSPAYLLQNNRIRQITDDTNQEREPHPLKTFSNLASGRVQEKDQLLIANHELYKEISLDALRRIINTNSPYKACLSIAKELKKEKNAAVTTVILKVISKGEAENQSAPEPAFVALEEEMQSRARKLRKKLIPVAVLAKKLSRQAGQAGLKAAKKTGQSVKEKVIPTAEALIHKGASQVGVLKNQVSNKMSKGHQEEAAPVPSGNQVVEILPSQKALEKQRLAQIANAAEERAEELYTPNSEKIPESLPTNPETAAMSKKASVTLSPQASLLFIEQWWQKLLAFLKPTRNRKIIYIVLALSIICATSLSILNKRQPVVVTANQNQNNQLISQAEELNKQAGTAIDLKQEIEASREIENAQNILNNLKDLNNSQHAKVEEIWGSLVSKTDILSKTIRLAEPVNRYSFTSTILSFVSNPPYFFGFNTTANLLRSGQGEPSQTQASLPLTDASDTIISLAKSNESDTAAYFLTRQNKVYRVAQNNNTTSISQISPTSGSFATGDSLATYIGNIYILDGKTGLLWKYINTGNGLAKGVSIIDINKYDIKKSLSLAIDGSIYVLKQDGSLLKFTSGQQETDFTLKDQPQLSKRMLQPLQVITDESMESIFILDGGLTSSSHSTAKIMEFSKNGSFVRQYGLPDSFTKVRWFDINPKDKKLWISDGSQVHEFTL